MGLLRISIDGRESAKRIIALNYVRSSGESLPMRVGSRARPYNALAETRCAAR
jgi:hypothetical protein